MRKIKYIIPLLTIIFISSCETENKQVNSIKNNSTDLPQYSLEIVDTIKIDEIGRLKLTDFHQEKELLLFHNRSDSKKDIFITNLQGEVIHRFNRNTNDDQGYGSELYGLSFDRFEDDRITVFSLKGYYQYSYDGELIKHVPNNAEEIGGNINFPMTLTSFEQDTNKYFVTVLNANDVGSSAHQEFYEKRKHLTLFDLSKQSFKTVIGFENNSVYRDGVHQRRLYFAYYDMNDDTGTLDVIYSYDPTVYSYKLENGDFTLVDRYDAKPDYFLEPSYSAFGELYDASREQITNSSFVDFDNYNEYAYIAYTRGVPKNIYDEETAQGVDQLKLTNMLQDNYKNYLQVFKNGEKLTRDILIPKQAQLVAAVLSEDTLILTPNRFLYEHDVEHYYVVKITNPVGNIARHSKHLK